MSFTIENIQFPSLLEFISQQRESGLYRADGTPAYALETDRWILSALNRTAARTLLEQAMHGLTELQFGEMLASAVPVSLRSFSEVYGILADCSRTLGITIPYTVARSDPAFFAAYTGGIDGGAFIMVSSEIIRHFRPDEIRFVLGHECGHIAAAHTTYKVAVDALAHAVLPMLGPVGLSLQRVAGFPLLAWSRRAEITADRAGLLCTRNLSACETALVKLIAGPLKENDVDIDEYLMRVRPMQSNSTVLMIQALLRSHPNIPQRIDALRLFASSQMYHHLTGLTPPRGASLLSDAELSRKTAALVRP